MTKKNILFILPFFPFPLTSGGHQAIFNGIKLLKDNANVFIFFEENWDEDHTNLYSQFQQRLGFSVKIIKYKKNKIKTKFCDTLKQYTKRFIIHLNQKNTNHNDCDPYVYIRNTPWGSVSNDRQEMVNDIIIKYSINIVQCEMLSTIGYVYNLPVTVKKIFVHHEIGFVKEEYLVKSKCSHYENYLERLSISQKYEVSALNLFDIIITVSSIDAIKLKNSGVVKEIMPSFCITDSTFLQVNKKLNPYTLSFVGSANHPPNIDGIKWFIDNCWEKLQEFERNYTLNIIGKWDNKNICEVMSFSNINILKAKHKAKKRNIHFQGYVDNLHFFLNNSITIVPILYGSGIRIKILEAACACSPIVSTTMGAEGIPLIPFDGNNLKEASCVLADSPQKFVDSIVLLQRTDVREAIVKNALQVIRNNFSTKEFANNRLHLYQ